MNKRFPFAYFVESPSLSDKKATEIFREWDWMEWWFNKWSSLGHHFTIEIFEMTVYIFLMWPLYWYDVQSISLYYVKMQPKNILFLWAQLWTLLMISYSSMYQKKINYKSKEHIFLGHFLFFPFPSNKHKNNITAEKSIFRFSRFLYIFLRCMISIFIMFQKEICNHEKHFSVVYNIMSDRKWFAWKTDRCSHEWNNKITWTWPKVDLSHPSYVSTFFF